MVEEGGGEGKTKQNKTKQKKSNSDQGSYIVIANHKENFEQFFFFFFFFEPLITLCVELSGLTQMMGGGISTCMYKYIDTVAFLPMYVCKVM